MQATLRAMLEGRRAGPLSWLLRAALAPAGLAVGGAAAARAALFRRNWRWQDRQPVPVVSVGNLTAGGTGKTPFVAMLARLLKSMGRSPAVLMRGYAGATPEKSDEALLYQTLVPGLMVFPGANRVLGAARARAAGADVLLLDDGFQHLRLARDLDVVLIDATCPFGGGLPLPAGMLREFPGALARADLLILTRADQVSPGRVEMLKETIRAAYADRPMLTASHRPSRLANLLGDPAPLDALAGRPVLAVSGIGRPDAFAATLRDLGADVRAALTFPDHYAYRAEETARRLAAFPPDLLPVTTEKDAMKLRECLSDEAKARMFAVGVEMRVSGLPELRQRLEMVCEGH